VYKDLEALERQNRLPAKLMPTLMELALEFNQDEYFIALVQKANLKSFPDEAIFSLAQLSGSERFPQLREILLKKLDYSFIASRPVLDMALVLTGTDHNAKVKYVSQLNYEDLPPSQRARMAMLLARYNFPAQTLHILSTLPSNDSSIDEFLPEIAVSYLQI